MKSKPVAAVLALFLGYLGVHRFYLGKRFMGMLYFFFFCLLFGISIEEGEPLIFIAILLGFIDAVLLSVMPQEEFDERYNRRYLRAAPAALPVAPRQRYYRQDTTPRTADTVEQLRAAGIRNFRAGRYEQALDNFDDALLEKPNDPALHFNISCCYARLGEAGPAMEHLELAFDSGFDRPEKLDTHTAFDWMRNRAAFEAIRNRYQVASTAPQPAKQKNASAEPAPTLASVTQSDPEPDEAGNLENEPETLAIDLLEQLAKLGDLRDRGLLTEEEFSRQKRRLLR